MAYQSPYSGAQVDAVIKVILSLCRDVSESDLTIIGSRFLGVASPNTDPGTVTTDVHYFAFANENATEYTKFRGIVLDAGEFAVLRYDKDSSTWVKNTVFKISDARLIQDIWTAIDEIKDEIELMLHNQEYMAACWDPSVTTPKCVSKSGDMNSIQYKPYLIDHTRNTGKSSEPVAELKLNNWFRKSDDAVSFMPVVGISQAQYNECMANDLYDDLSTPNPEPIYPAGTYDPMEFFTNHMQIFEDENGVKYLGTSKKLYKSSGNEVSHYLMPWETLDTKYSIYLGVTHSLYFLQNTPGMSGKRWNSIFLNPKSWDGIEAVHLKPTGIAPGPSGAIVENNVTKMRNFYTVFDGADSGYVHSNGYQERTAVFKGGHMYPTSNGIQAVRNMQWARNNNADPTKSYPFAEGGWPAYNAFVSWLEIKYGTRDLHAANLFSSGISSNDSCSNEANWLANGGVKFKRSTEETFHYAGWATYTFSKTLAGSNTYWSDLVNYYFAKEPCLEAQMVASFAAEFGIAAGQHFKFYGAEFYYDDINGVDGLSSGHMNCIMHKILHDPNMVVYENGTEVHVDAYFNLRIGLAEGANLSGDIFAYWQGGIEAVGTCIGTASPHTGDPVKIYVEPDQELWHSETGITLANLGRFNFEDQYQLLADAQVLGNNYSYDDYPMTPWKRTNGGGLHTGMCHYQWDNNYWSTTVNARVRIGIRFRGYANNGLCSPRALFAHAAASHTNHYFGGSAQVRLPERAS